MKIKQVLLIYKKSAYELLHKRHERLLRAKDPVARKEQAYFLKSHEDHYETLARIESILKEKNIK